MDAKWKHVYLLRLFAHKSHHHRHLLYHYYGNAIESERERFKHSSSTKKKSMLSIVFDAAFPSNHQPRRKLQKKIWWKTCNFTIIIIFISYWPLLSPYTHNWTNDQSHHHHHHLERLLFCQDFSGWRGGRGLEEGGMR